MNCDHKRVAMFLVGRDLSVFLYFEAKNKQRFSRRDDKVFYFVFDD